jgi:hypothetical protein
MGTLLRRSPAQEEQVIVLVGAERVVGQIDAVVDHTRVGQVGHVRTLRVADGHEPHPASDERVQRLRVVVERTVNRMNHGQPQRRRGDQRRGGRVDVEDIEPVGITEGERGVHHVVPHGVDEVGPGGLREERLHTGPAGGVAGGEQRDVVAQVDQTVRHERHHPLDAAVALWRDGQPRRRDLGDLHEPGWALASLTRSPPRPAAAPPREAARSEAPGEPAGRRGREARCVPRGLASGRPGTCRARWTRRFRTTCSPRPLPRCLHRQGRLDRPRRPVSRGHGSTGLLPLSRWDRDVAQLGTAQRSGR